MFRARHLQEDRLFECYLAEKSGEPIDPPAADHLTDCARCGARYAGLARFMDGLRSDAEAETDAIFSAEHLRVQQQQIARRIEHLGHAARVISFPGHPAAQHLSSASTRIAPRWIAAAAAAGLFIGIYVGTFFDSGARVSRTNRAASASRAITQPMHVAPSPVLASSPDPASPAIGAVDVGGDDGADRSDANDEFLSELELALERPRTRELIALDELTPHVREVPTSFRTTLR